MRGTLTPGAILEESHGNWLNGWYIGILKTVRDKLGSANGSNRKVELQTKTLRTQVVELTSPQQGVTADRPVSTRQAHRIFALGQHLAALQSRHLPKIENEVVERFEYLNILAAGTLWWLGKNMPALISLEVCRHQKNSRSRNLSTRPRTQKRYFYLAVKISTLFSSWYDLLCLCINPLQWTAYEWALKKDGRHCHLMINYKCFWSSEMIELFSYLLALGFLWAPG